MGKTINAIILAGSLVLAVPGIIGTYNFYKPRAEYDGLSASQVAKGLSRGDPTLQSYARNAFANGVECCVAGLGLLYLVSVPSRRKRRFVS